MTVPQPRRCKDCVAEGVSGLRPTPHPGPRCATHHRTRRRVQKARQHANRVESTYGITADEYARLYAAQGGVCYVCRRATGATKKLAVDHDHKKGCGHDPKMGCPNCIRGLLCATCNTVVIGRYDAHALARAIQYLVRPPARTVLGDRSA